MAIPFQPYEHGISAQKRGRINQCGIIAAARHYRIKTSVIDKDRPHANTLPQLQAANPILHLLLHFVPDSVLPLNLDRIDGSRRLYQQIELHPF